jgi:hypothetical protein
MGILEQLRSGPAGRGGAIPIERSLRVKVKFFGRYRGSFIRNGVLLVKMSSLPATER